MRCIFSNFKSDHWIGAVHIVSAHSSVCHLTEKEWFLYPWNYLDKYFENFQKLLWSYKVIWQFFPQSHRLISDLGNHHDVGFITVVKSLSTIGRGGDWHNVPQFFFYLSLNLLAIVHPDGNQTILSRALLDADFGPVGRNQHPARLRERPLN